MGGGRTQEGHWRCSLSRAVREDLSEEKVTFEQRGKESGRELCICLGEERSRQRELQWQSPPGAWVLKEQQESKMAGGL